jgi:hypothetical protein
MLALWFGSGSGIHNGLRPAGGSDLGVQRGEPRKLGPG